MFRLDFDIWTNCSNWTLAGNLAACGPETKNNPRSTISKEVQGTVNSFVIHSYTCLLPSANASVISGLMHPVALMSTSIVAANYRSHCGCKGVRRYYTYYIWWNTASIGSAGLLHRFETRSTIWDSFQPYRPWLYQSSLGLCNSITSLSYQGTST